MEKDTYILDVKIETLNKLIKEKSETIEDKLRIINININSNSNKIFENEIKYRYDKKLLIFSLSIFSLFALVFFGFSYHKIGKTIEEEMKKEGIRQTIQEIDSAKTSAITQLNSISSVLNSLNFHKIDILDNTYIQENGNQIKGEYFNFSGKYLTQQLGDDSWHDDMFIIMNLRSGEIQCGWLFSKDVNQGGDKNGDSHGRTWDSHEAQWKAEGDSILVYRLKNRAKDELMPCGFIETGRSPNLNKRRPISR